MELYVSCRGFCEQEPTVFSYLKEKKSMVCKEFSDIQAFKVHGI